MTADIRIIATPGSLAEAIGNKVASDQAGTVTLIDASNPQPKAGFAELDDEAFTRGLVTPVLDISDALQVALTNSRRIIVIGSQAYLGDWHRIPEAAAGAAIIGLVRSLALEYASADMAINMIALPTDALNDDAVLIQEAALLVELLIKSSAISGQILTLDNGRSLKMAQARRR